MKSGHRHLLVIYKLMLDRWLRATLALGLFMLAFAWPAYQIPGILAEPWRIVAWVGAGIVVLFFTLFLFLVRKQAYIQPFSDHLRLVTPFLRLNISYRRFHRTYTTEMQHLFKSKKSTGLRRDMLRPLLNKTLVVIELTALPISRFSMHLFLSPLFLPDQTPRLALLVPDWLALSTEMGSLRGAWNETQRQTPSDPRSALLASLSQR